MEPIAHAAPEPLRLFVTHNETTQHGCEIEASSHEDAAERYRKLMNVQGYACITTSDTGVFFGRIDGILHRRQHTWGPEGAPERGRQWRPHFAPPRR